MSFADKAAKPTSEKITPCLVRAILESLPDDEAGALRGMLAEPVELRPHVALVDDFADEGYEISDYTIGKHRRLRCSCRKLVLT